MTLAQVPLTDDGACEGGLLLFACKDGRLMHVQRRMGSMMAHDGDAVHALLAGQMDVLVTGRFERLPGELVIEAFDLLEAQDIGLLPLQEGDDAIDAETNRIDVPGRQGKAVHVVGEAVCSGLQSASDNRVRRPPNQGKAPVGCGF